MNNFAEFGKEQEDSLDNERKETIRAGIWSTLGTFKYVGDIFDVYVPKFIKFLVGLSGGNVASEKPLQDAPDSDDDHGEDTK